MKNPHRIVLALMSMFCLPLSMISQNNLTKHSVSLFLTQKEYHHLTHMPGISPERELLKAIEIRVNQRALTPNLTDPDATTEWWHHASEYLTDAALIYALSPSDKVGAWLRGNVLNLIRCPVVDWERGSSESYENSRECTRRKIIY